MIINTSANNVQKIEEIIRSSALETVFIVDYSKNISAFLDFISALDAGVRRVYCFTEKEPPLDFKNITRRPWTLAEYRIFLTARSKVDLNGHTSLYEGDGSRLAAWRRRYAQGPLYGFSQRVQRCISPGALCDFLHNTTAFFGLFLQALIPSLRWATGYAGTSRANMDIKVFFDNGPEKDHYGENPLIGHKISEFSKAAELALQEPGSRTGFFIVTGPRHEYINHILELEKKSGRQNFVLFCRGLFRPGSYENVRDMKAGFFSAGTNLTRNGKRVYSDHCLSIGAGEKELWIYNPGRVHEAT